MTKPRGGKGRTRVIVETPENEDEREPETEAEGATADAERQAEDVLGSVPLRTTVKLWRRDRQGREAYLDAIDAAALGGGDVKAGLPEYVKEHYGGGEYRFEIRGPVGKGRLKGYRGGDSFTIDRAIPAKYPHDPAEPEEPARAPVVPTPNGAIADVLQSSVLTLIMDLVRQGGESAKLQNELTRASIDQLRANMTPPREERDPLETFRTMAEIMKPAQQAGSPLAQLKELLELRDLLDTGGSKDASALGVVAELAPQLLTTINKALDQRPSQPAATIHNPDGSVIARTPPVASPESGVPVTEQPTAAGGAAVLQLLGKWVPYLVKWAAQDRDPAVAAGTIFWEIPAGYHATLRAAIEPEDAVAQIVAGFPALAPFTDWLAEVRTELLVSLNADDDGNPPDDSPG